MGYPRVVITPEMLAAAERLADACHVNRTVACAEGTRNDTLAGILGEMAACQFMYNDWRMARPGDSKGRIDYADVEVKASMFPFSRHLNLLVREDYARKRKAAIYVQVILDVPHRGAPLAPGVEAVIAGWATAAEVDAAPLKDWGSKRGEAGGYRCHGIPIFRLRDIATMPPQW